MKKINKIILIISAIVFLSCGYKPINQTGEKKFKIIEISSTGEKRINYNIKSKLLFSDSDSSPNLIFVNFNTNKEKLIKEKNIKNEITKYQLKIITEVSFELIGKNKNSKFTITEIGDYKVSSNRINTLNNEKKLTENLTDNTIEKIIKKLNLEMYDY